MTLQVSVHSLSYLVVQAHRELTGQFSCLLITTHQALLYGVERENPLLMVAR